MRTASNLLLRALQVGDYSATDAHEFGRRDCEVVIPCSRSSPHLVVLQQVRINEYTQLCAVTKGRHAAVGLSNPRNRLLPVILHQFARPRRLYNFSARTELDHPWFDINYWRSIDRIKTSDTNR